MTPQNHDAWLQQIKVPCPTCGAAAGEPCTKPGPYRTTIVIRGTHNARKARHGDGTGKSDVR